ncbi:hypothetical protein E2R55_20850 [Vibrio vulnificus]|nr:hypothetical protein E2R55_20850 [Vibrio vulnificus]
MNPLQFRQEPEEYTHYYNHQLIIVKLKGMNPVDYRVHALLMPNILGTLQFKGSVFEKGCWDIPLESHTIKK